MKHLASAVNSLANFAEAVRLGYFKRGELDLTGEWEWCGPDDKLTDTEHSYAVWAKDRTYPVVSGNLKVDADASRVTLDGFKAAIHKGWFNKLAPIDTTGKWEWCGTTAQLHNEWGRWAINVPYEIRYEVLYCLDSTAMATNAYQFKRALRKGLFTRQIDIAGKWKYPGPSTQLFEYREDGRVWSTTPATNEQFKADIRTGRLVRP